jgi:hypothetical protein
MLRQPVRGARGQQRVQVREVVVDRQPLHARAARDVGHGRLPDPDLLVQRGRRRGDPGARRLLGLGPGLQLVSPLLG